MFTTPSAHISLDAASSPATSTGIDSTGASLLIVEVAVAGVATITVTDSVGGNSNSFTALTPYTSGGTSQIFICLNPQHTGTGHTVTVTNSTGGVITAEFSAWTGAASFGGETGNTAASSSTSISPGSVTPDVDGALIITGVTANVASEAYSIDGGFTILDQLGTNKASAFGYLVQSFAAAASPTWSYPVARASSSPIAWFRPSRGRSFSAIFG